MFCWRFVRLGIVGSRKIKCGVTVAKVRYASVLEAERVSPAAGAYVFPRISFSAASMHRHGF